jgi:hypothetical protein
MRISKHQRITLAEAKLRALRCLSKKDRRHLSKASEVGHAIWPRSGLRAQGLGLASARILKLLTDEGLVRWDVREQFKWKDWGYHITIAGRNWLRDHP